MGVSFSFDSLIIVYLLLNCQITYCCQKREAAAHSEMHCGFFLNILFHNRDPYLILGILGVRV